MNLLNICLVSLLGLSLSAFAADAPAKKEKLRHIVTFKFKDNATPGQIKQVEDAFRALKTKIPQIVSIEWGTNRRPSSIPPSYNR